MHDRPVPDAEYGRAKAEGREAVAPAHSEASAIVTAAEILEYARDYQGASAALRAETPALAVEREAAPGLTPEEAMRMAEMIEQVQTEVRENFVTLEADIRGVVESAKRAAFLRDLAALKAEAAPLIRDDLGLQGYRPEAAHADYRGLVVPAGDARAAAIKAEADREVARLAERFGLQPEATLVRFGGEAVSVGLGRDYRARGAGRARGGQGCAARAGGAGRRGCRAARRVPSPGRDGLPGGGRAVARAGAAGPAWRAGSRRRPRRGRRTARARGRGAGSGGRCWRPRLRVASAGRAIGRAR